jgi:hypothetical protein
VNGPRFLNCRRQHKALIELGFREMTYRFVLENAATYRDTPLPNCWRLADFKGVIRAMRLSLNPQRRSGRYTEQSCSLEVLR